MHTSHRAHATMAAAVLLPHPSAATMVGGHIGRSGSGGYGRQVPLLPPSGSSFQGLCQISWICRISPARPLLSPVPPSHSPTPCDSGQRLSGPSAPDVPTDLPRPPGALDLPQRGVTDPPYGVTDPLNACDGSVDICVCVTAPLTVRPSSTPPPLWRRHLPLQWRPLLRLLPFSAALPVFLRGEILYLNADCHI